MERGCRNGRGGPAGEERRRKGFSVGRSLGTSGKNARVAFVEPPTATPCVMSEVTILEIRVESLRYRTVRYEQGCIRPLLAAG